MINAPISTVIAHLEHADMLAVAGAGLPVPATTQRIDLALKPGVPGFLETLEVVLTEMLVEKACVSEDTSTKSPQIYAGIQKLLGKVQIETLPHLESWELTGSTKATIRIADLHPLPMPSLWLEPGDSNHRSAILRLLDQAEERIP